MSILLPAFLLSSPSLSFFLFSNFTHLQPEGLRSLKLNCHSNIVPRRQAFKTSCLGTSLRVYRTELAWSQQQERERQWQTAYRRRPTALETQEKRQRRKHADHCQQFTRAQFPADRFPAKFGCQPIKLELYPLAHTHPCTLGISGYIKRVE